MDSIGYVKDTNTIGHSSLELYRNENSRKLQISTHFGQQYNCNQQTNIMNLKFVITLKTKSTMFKTSFTRFKNEKSNVFTSIFIVLTEPSFVSIFYEEKSYVFTNIAIEKNWQNQNVIYSQERHII